MPISQPWQKVLLAEGRVGLGFPTCKMGLSVYIRGIVWEQRMCTAPVSTYLQLGLSISGFIFQPGVG